MTMSRLRPELMPPPPGFQIFGEAPASEMDAFINFLGDMSYGYQEGYSRAFRVLVEHVRATDSSHDLLVYPILFVARQHIELTLKSIHRLISRYNETISEPKLIHNLAELWLPCKQFLLQEWPNDDHDWIAAVDDLTTQLTQFDAKADAFRFATLTTRAKSLDGVKRINLQHLFDVMHPIMRWLCGIEAILVEMNVTDDHYD